MSARPRNRYVKLALFLVAVIFAGLAVQRFIELRLNRSLDEPAFAQAGDAAAEFRVAFNNGRGETRIVVLVSAPSLASEQDIEALRRLLREHRRAPVRIVSVWRGPAPARSHTTRYGDGRVHHVWDPDSRLFAEALEGSLMVYPPGVAWSDPPPEPAAQGEPARAMLPELRRLLSLPPALPTAPAPRPN
jgi:sugar phosphate isomerase/epimerase